MAIINNKNIVQMIQMNLNLDHRATKLSEILLFLSQLKLFFNLKLIRRLFLSTLKSSRNQKNMDFLESLFIGSDEIKRELPKETGESKKVIKSKKF